MSLRNCSGFTISGGSFTSTNHVRIVHKRVVTTQRKGKERTIWDDYNRVKIGDICLESTIATSSSVRRQYFHDEEGKKQYRLWRNVDAHRNIGIARLRGEHREEKFLCVTYDGPDALKAFKKDFGHFAHIKNANVAQIFGYNDNEQGLPALVFYGALIPLGRIVLDGYQYLPLLYSYFAHQFGRMKKELSMGNPLIGEMWVDPRTGALQKGPYLELPYMQSLTMLGTGSNTIPNTHSTHLPIQTYSDSDTVFKYLTRSFPARTILTGIRMALSALLQPLANGRVIPMLSSVPGAIYNRRSGDIIARLPGAGERWHYGFWRLEGRIPDGMRESQVVMDDGSVRFTVTSTEIQDFQGIELWYGVYPLEERRILAESWLAQAHSVFSQLGIHEDDWENYCILTGFLLHFERTSPQKNPNIPQNVYLFIQPVPCPSDDKAIWRSWMEHEKYFWSFDPLGREMVPELVEARSGLPSFTSGMVAWDASWSFGHYAAIQKLHTSKGFDSTTTDLAISLGLFILEVIGDENRFKALEESSYHTLPSASDKLQGEKPRTVVKPIQTDPRQQQPRNFTPKSIINPSGKSHGPEKWVNSHDARPVSTRVKASERNLKTTGRRSVSIPTSATNARQPTRASTFGKKPEVSVKRITKQVGGAIDPSKRTNDRDQGTGKIGQPKPLSRQEAKKPAWR